MFAYSLVANLFGRIAAYLSYRRTYKALASLDDRELADLGIGRGRIEDIARSVAFNH